MGRTPEQGHTVACMAAAVIAAVENIRDSLKDQQSARFAPLTASAADFEFATWLQDNGPRWDAERYLQDGTMTCVCPDLHN